MAKKTTENVETKTVEKAPETAEITEKTPEVIEEVSEIVEADPNKKVSIRIPRAQAHEDPNFFVAVNGVSYILPKGQVSEVPAYIADEIRRSWAAEDAYFDKAAEMVESAQQVTQ